PNVRGECDPESPEPGSVLGEVELAHSLAVTSAFTSSGAQVSASLLEAAVKIGWALCRSAFWDHERRVCNWIGRPTAEMSEYGGPVTPTSAALGPDLYAGSAGVALFLAQLHAATGDPEFQRTALAGIARSIRQLDRVQPMPSMSSLSFFIG